MDPKTQEQLDTLEIKLDETLKLTKRMYRYMQVTAILTLIFFVLPLILMLFAIPALISSMNETMSILQL